MFAVDCDGILSALFSAVVNTVRTQQRNQTLYSLFNDRTTRFIKRYIRHIVPHIAQMLCIPKEQLVRKCTKILKQNSRGIIVGPASNEIVPKALSRTAFVHCYQTT